MKTLSQTSQWIFAIAALLSVAWSAAPTAAQDSYRPPAYTIIVPQTRIIICPPHYPHPVPMPRPIPVVEPGVAITQIDADVIIRDQAAVTTLLIALSNPSGRRQEAELLVPVPDGAVVRGLDFQGGGAEPSAQLLPREEARRLYNEIVNRSKDPALLEFAGYNMIRSSVFPVEPRGTQKIKLTYETLLPATGNRVDYFLPRSEAVDYRVPWRMTIDIQTKQPISTIYSPSHALEPKRIDERHVRLTLAEHARQTPGSLRLSYLVGDAGVIGSIFAYPDPRLGGGYFLMLAAPPAEALPDSGKPVMKRELTLVLDRSGSMNGPKLKQVREAAMQVIAGLELGETFNIIIYNESVEMFSKTPLVKSAETEQSARQYLEHLTARGGTNIHDALLESLRQKPMDGALPIVLFLTDGLPTIGQTSEVAIRELVEKNNPFKRRVFTFGVGVDVNTPLLERIADQTRASSEFVLPEENVEVKVSAVFNRLTGPVMADPTLTVLEKNGNEAVGRVTDVIPSRLPDLFRDDQLVLAGQYRGDAPLRFRISGNYLNKAKSFEIVLNPAEATAMHSFVPRLWASRKIALLVDAVRAMGADAGQPGMTVPANDPKFKELVDEIVRLSTEFGILTEYTAFLAREGTPLAGRPAMEQLRREAGASLSARAMSSRSGYGSVNQEANIKQLKTQTVVNPRNNYITADMQQVEVTNVQQSTNNALYCKDGTWVDSRLMNVATPAKPSRVVKFGSKDYFELAEQLARQNRQSEMSYRGDLMLQVDGQAVLVQMGE